LDALDLYLEDSGASGVTYFKDDNLPLLREICGSGSSSIESAGITAKRKRRCCALSSMQGWTDSALTTIISRVLNDDWVHGICSKAKWLMNFDFSRAHDEAHEHVLFQSVRFTSFEVFTKIFFPDSSEPSNQRSPGRGLMARHKSIIDGDS
jgi:hypothetical protein